MKYWIWILFSLSVMPFTVLGQNNAVDSSYRTKPKITPFLVPSYSPEVKLMIVAGGILTFQTGSDIDTKRSSLPFNVGWSTNNSKEIDFRPVIFGRNNKTRFFGRLSLKDMPDHYFGVGYENGRNTELSDSTTLYHRFWYQSDINVVRRIKGNFYGGLRLDFNGTEATELSSLMAEDQLIVEQGADIHNSGIGIIMQYDSRDFEVNANSGMLLNLVGTFYGSPINSDFSYRMYVLDYRQFKTIFRKGRILAWEIKIYNGSGDIPWSDLARIGTAFDLRGYRFGQYRDKTAGFGILEYRHTFRKMRAVDKKLTPHRLVLWAGTGSLGERIDEWNDWLPNFGIGYRFEVQPSINARIDFGFGVESTGFYINFNEAF